MRTIAIINQKGGVGKTTTAINLSAGLAMHKRRVLLIDLDPQGNSSISYDFDIDQLSHSMFDAMTKVGNNDWKSIIKKTHVANLAIAPASMNLAALEHELATHDDRNDILNTALEKINSSYDYIIIDCPPSLGLLTVNALYAVRELFIPIQLSYFALEGVRQLITIIEIAKKELPKNGPQITGIIATLYDGRTNMSKETLKAIKGFFGKTVFKTAIKRNVKLEEATSHHKTIFEYAPRSAGAQAYRDLTSEVISQERSI